MTDLYVLILAGGRGARFWPLSRRALPKQCIALDGGATLLQKTVARLLPLVSPDRVLVVTGPDMEAAIRDQLPDVPAANILVEPWGRNTAPCIGWGAVEVGRRGGGEAVMAVLPADHEIGDPAALRAALTACVEAARATNALITVGIRPTRPESGYGYLQVGSVMGTWGEHEFRMVDRFTEKPDAVMAQAYVDGGQHLWNAGMFVFTVDAIRDAVRQHLPGMAEALEEIQRRPDCVHSVWGGMEATSIDYGVMERSRHILTAPCAFGWSDLGSWDSAGGWMPEAEGGTGVAKAVFAHDSEGCVVHAPSKTVALVGVEDLVIVDTPDALLVMRKDRAQEVRTVLSRIEAELGPELT